MIEFDSAKGGGLVPSIVQDVDPGVVLMVGYMNRAAFMVTIETGKATPSAAGRGALASRASARATTLS